MPGQSSRSKRREAVVPLGPRLDRSPAVGDRARAESGSRPKFVSAIGVVCGRERAEGGKVALGVALSDVDGQIGDGAGVPFVEAQRARAERPIRSHERLVDRFLDNRADASGRQLRQP